MSASVQQGMLENSGQFAWASQRPALSHQRSGLAERQERGGILPVSGEHWAGGGRP